MPPKGFTGKTLSHETKAKMSESHKGKKHTEITKKKMSSDRTGKKHSIETIRKMQESHNNMSYETKEKMSNSKRGNKNPHFGHHHTEEAKQKQREAKLGKNNPQFGKTHTDDEIKKMSESHKGELNHQFGKTIPKEVRAKMSKSRIGKTARENNPNWQGGVTPLNNQIRGCNRMIAWRTAIFERDKYTCQVTGKRFGELEAHHIVMFSTIMTAYNIKTLEEAEACPYLWDINNGITISKKVHRQMHKNN